MLFVLAKKHPNNVFYLTCRFASFRRVRDDYFCALRCEISLHNRQYRYKAGETEDRGSRRDIP